MLYQWIRVFKSDNGTLADVSVINQEEGTTIALDLVAGEDYIYIGQHFPFNNFWMQIDTANTVATTINIDYWSGNSNGWQAAVDILDGTVTSGVPLAKSGVVQFSPHMKKSWENVSDPEDNGTPTELSTTRVYNVYWMRIKYTDSLDVATKIKRLAYSFSQTQQLDNTDTQINQFLDSFSPGKTDWEDEIYTASLQLISDLRRRGLITHYGQVLRFEDVTMACDLKSLILIYQNLGPGFRVKLEDARAEYEKVLDMGRFTFDQNQDAFTDGKEITNKVKLLIR